MPPLPEQLAREQIDRLLTASGWVLQDYKELNLGAGHGIALREVPLKSGRCDYLLLVDRIPLGVVEAKKVGSTLSTVADQSGHYGANLPDFLADLVPAAAPLDRGAPRQYSRSAKTRDGALAPSLPFAYESTGVETFFRDERDPSPRSRRVFSFHRPETLAAWLAEPDTLRARLAALPTAHPLSSQNLRACQVEGITHLEESFAADRPRALIQMATGAGKTYTACAFTSTADQLDRGAPRPLSRGAKARDGFLFIRLIKHAGAKRVLFLVDRANLGRQAMAEFQQFVAPDTGRKFTEVYNVQHLTSPHLDTVARVSICTIPTADPLDRGLPRQLSRSESERWFPEFLRGEELDEDLDEKSGYEIATADDRPRDVAYTDRVPIETFDFIVTDECHRSIYGLWRQVLEYFDAFPVADPPDRNAPRQFCRSAKREMSEARSASLIGLTATPSKQTIGFFPVADQPDRNARRQHSHSKCERRFLPPNNHERAVADGVNVGYEVYRIKTQVTAQGGKVEKGFYVDRRSKETRAVRWERLDEDLTYPGRGPTGPRPASPTFAPRKRERWFRCPTDLDRSVVVTSQIRTVLTAFRDALFIELFPGRTLVPKALIFAKHAS